MLYVTAEMLGTGDFYDLVERMITNCTLKRIIVDEAHCISEWGSDFRPDYGRIGRYKESFPQLQFCAFTATATKRVKSDILAKLALSSVSIHTGSFNRKNIVYHVRYKDEVVGNDLNDKWKNVKNASNYAHVLKAIEEQLEVGNKIGIIYCHSRNECDELATVLNSLSPLLNFPPSSPYHAGLGHKEREKIQLAWLNGEELKIIVATISFGMGVDNPGVRFVFHNTMPKSMESFYQESGRAGRDGNLATSILFYSKQEASKLKFLVQKEISSHLTRTQQFGGFVKQLQGDLCTKTESFDAMMLYCRENRCKRQMICEYFGEFISPSSECKKGCDYCLNPSQTCQRIVNYFSYSLPFFSKPESHLQGEVGSGSEFTSFKSSQEIIRDKKGVEKTGLLGKCSEGKRAISELLSEFPGNNRQKLKPSSLLNGATKSNGTVSVNEFCTASARMKEDQLGRSGLHFNDSIPIHKVTQALDDKFRKGLDVRVLFPDQIHKCYGLDNLYREKCLDLLIGKNAIDAIQKEYSIFKESTSAIIYKTKMAKAMKE